MARPEMGIPNGVNAVRQISKSEAEAGDHRSC
jgi:hypothetical protein